ncbi:thioredoxin domain PLP3A-like protein [Actinidia rufa]|uniref:Thioredoxin domain PLP3A-like protein n=1 Tax=Actinidia rufa TaxID=165716 RepID=A0A7J0HEH0_9ERIC|nr:thioredoxin domain PLP3A-like protein [Actinidia rufa]
MSSLPSENHHVPKHHALPFMSLPSIQLFNFMAQRHDTTQDLAQAQDTNDPKVEELLTQEKAPASTSINQEVDLDELMDDPELEKLHADRIAALKKEAEKREILKKQGCGEYREITEGDFLGEVTGSEKVICHFYHREFYRCK